MEVIVERNNLKKALVRVQANEGAGGIDGMVASKSMLLLQQKHRIRAFDSRESRFRFCQKLTPKAAFPGKLQLRNSLAYTRQPALSGVFHGRLILLKRTAGLRPLPRI
jgi:hypothetical protein